MLFTLSGDAIQEIHIAFVKLDDLEVLSDPTGSDGFGEDDTTSVNLVGDQDGRWADSLLFSDGDHIVIGQQGRI